MFDWLWELWDEAEVLEMLSEVDEYDILSDAKEIYGTDEGADNASANQ